MKSFEETKAAAEKIAAQAAALGGRAYYVGGCVRDSLMGALSPDTDIEVHGLTPEQLCGILDSLGSRMAVGESFGIYSLRGFNLDVAMPRSEKATGRGHRDFETYVDPFIGTEKACMRRDFTVNAMMKDILTGEIIDRFGGRSDLENKILRHVNNESFPEDPLRVLRAAQFSARFGFTVADTTTELCRHIALDALPPERIDGELRKAMLKAEKPSLFFEFLRSCDGLDIWFPEVKALAGVEQDKRYHTEGDVWVHTMMVLDQAAKRRDRAADPYGFMLSALCHDFGKPLTTEFINGNIHSYNHEKAGLEPAGVFLHRITSEKKLIKYVLNMILLHMSPNQMAAQKASVKGTNHLFDKACDPYGLIQLAVSDSLGMTFDRPYYPSEDWLCQRLDIYNRTMAAPYVTGEDLIAAGLKPDENFREILAYSHKLRLAGIEKESALKQTLAYARTLK